MSPQQQKDWRDAVLREVFLAVIAHQHLREVLVFKGARILNLHLHSKRQSLDIDANVTLEFTHHFPVLDQRAEWLRDEIERALRVYFEAMEPVRFTLQGVKVTKRPPKVSHPRGWDGLVVAMQVMDQQHRGVLGMPALELEIAAPELLGQEAITWLAVGKERVQAYALHRIAGEKLRAFLTSLPAYRRKMGGGERPHRVKDLHDLARILSAKPLSDRQFWGSAADEFRLACESRFVDCAGLDAFLEEWTLTQQAYKADANLAAVPFAQAERALREIVGFFEELRVFPLAYPLPALNAQTKVGASGTAAEAPSNP